MHLKANPLLRHNIVQIPINKTKVKDSNGEVVNPFEEPPQLTKKLMRMFMSPGKTAIVVCAGVGSEIIGALQAGVSIVATECDPTQFLHCKARVKKLCEGNEEDVEEEKEGTMVESARDGGPQLKQTVEEQEQTAQEQQEHVAEEREAAKEGKKLEEGKLEGEDEALDPHPKCARCRNAVPFNDDAYGTCEV
eukprot:gb/GEZN01009058.1/.p1 GENE.gb/GEZN01009058.1/~~gb/GEZN01009058.1/.p1  ORF type:complete len:192 (-),score=59.58 gb/GEZN01009058.1/:122-697(-)